MNKRLLLAAAVFLGLGRAAHADPFNDAWQKGQDDFNLGRYDQAKIDFEKARDLDPKKPGPWRYLGKIAKVQQSWDDCVKNLTEAVRLNPNSPQKKDVVADLEICRAALHRPVLTVTLGQGQGGLAVLTSPEGAQVDVDGIGKGASPLEPVPLTKGPHKVHIAKEGFLPVDTDVDVVETITVDVVVTLSPDPNYQKPNGTEDPDKDAKKIKVGWILLTVNGPGKKAATILFDGAEPKYIEDGSIEAEPGEHTLEVHAEGYESYKGKVRVARAQKRAVMIDLRSMEGIASAKVKGYALLGGAVALGVTGFLLTQKGADKAEEASDLVEANRALLPPGLNQDPEPLDPKLRPRIESLRSDAKSYNNYSMLCYGVAAVAVGFSVYYLIQARPADETTEAGATAPSLVPGFMAGGDTGYGASLTWTQEMDW